MAAFAEVLDREDRPFGEETCFVHPHPPVAGSPEQELRRFFTPFPGETDQLLRSDQRLASTASSLPTASSNRWMGQSSGT